MDKYTFSDSQGAQNFVKILETLDSRWAGKAKRILSKWFDYSSGVMSIQDGTVRRGTLDLWRQHFLRLAVESDFPKTLETHLCNAIVTQYRKCLNNTRKRDRGIK